MPDKQRKAAVSQVETINAAKLSNDRVSFEHASMTVAALIEKYSKPKAVKQEMVKPEAAKPETAKGVRKPRAA
jgi:hypothetical protein